MNEQHSSLNHVAYYCNVMLPKRPCAYAFGSAVKYGKFSPARTTVAKYQIPNAKE
jgi:hypothetical protein